MSRITATLDSGVSVELSNGRHVWRADEPTDLGGEDSGPNPYELLLGSLAACTVTTLALYCRHKGIELEGVEATYDFDRVHAEDCDLCDEEDSGLIDRIQAHVTLSGTFDEAQRKRLSQIVGRCPVHKTLEKGPKIFDEVSFA